MMIIMIIIIMIIMIIIIMIIMIIIITIIIMTIIIILVLYGAHIHLLRCSRRLYYYYPGISPGNLVAHSAFQGINSCRVPICYTWVERDNCD